MSSLSMNKRQFMALMAGSAVILSSGAAMAAGKIRIAVLKTGTVNWELDVIRTNGFDKANGFELDIVEVANNDATRVALQAGDADVITSDWLLVARDRGEGGNLTFVPFSSSVGSVMVKADGGIKTLSDLKGKKVGVAGGPLDKNWLLLQGLGKRDFGIDLANETSPQFGAPPLLSEQLESGDLDAALTFWNFCARLETKGFVPIISGLDAAKAMGAKGSISAVGYTFSEKWATDNLDTAKGLVAASRAAKDLLKTSDAEWDRIRPMMNADADPVFHALRDKFRDGIPSRPITEEVEDAKTIYGVLVGLGGEDLVGKATTFPDGVYWSELSKV